MKTNLKIYSVSALVIMLFHFQAIGQKSQLNNAFYYLTKMKDLSKAKEAIDKAAVHDKTFDEGRTHYFRGLVYQSIATSEVAEEKQLGGDSAVRVAYESYKKAMEYEKEGSQVYKDSEKNLPNIWLVAYNNGVEEYTNENYAQAIKYYTISSQIKPTDTLAFQSIAYSADKIGDYETFYNVLQKLKGLNHENLTYFYNRLLTVYTKEGGEHYDLDKALKLVEEAKQKYPDNKAYITQELIIYQNMGKQDVLVDKIKEAIAKDPTNDALYLTLGSLYENQAELEGISKEEAAKLKSFAVENYKKALEINPKNFDAAFNLGIMEYNKGVEVKNKIETLNPKDYHTKGSQMEKEAKKYWGNAIEYLEVAYKIKPEVPNLLQALKICHAKTGNTKMAAKYLNEYNALK